MTLARCWRCLSQLARLNVHERQGACRRRRRAAAVQGASRGARGGVEIGGNQPSAAARRNSGINSVRRHPGMAVSQEMILPCVRILHRLLARGPVRRIAVRRTRSSSPDTLRIAAISEPETMPRRRIVRREPALETHRPNAGSFDERPRSNFTTGRGPKARRREAPMPSG